MVATGVLLALFGSGCRRKLAPSFDAGVAAAPSTSGVRVAAIGVSTEEPWLLAREGDPLELARLCDAVGASRLGEAIDDPASSPDDRATAVRALAFAEDPTPALDSLCKLVTASSVDASTLALQTLVQVAPRRRQIEEIEGGAWRRCGEATLALLEKTRDPTRRTLAIRASMALAERGALDPKRVPER
jgi:hypothetical protein